MSSSRIIWGSLPRREVIVNDGQKLGLAGGPEGYHLSPIRGEDAPDFVEHFKDREIFENTLTIPFPYTDEDARWWVGEKEKELENLGFPVSYGIREPGGRLVGAVGCDGLVPGMKHRAELGYWLARPFWGKGIMTAAVRSVCRHGFQSWGLEKITAHVFEFNLGSRRVLEKSGFSLEGQMRRHFVKEDRFVDARLYGLLKGDLDGVAP